MRKTISIFLVGASVLVLAAGAALAVQNKGDGGEDKSAGTGDAKDDGEAQALEFEGRPTSVNGYVDLGQTGATPGDLFVFSDELFATQNGSQNSSEKVGQADGRCTLIDPPDERFQCTIISSFDDGTITTDGVLTNKQNAPSMSSVTGGTGTYRGATGEASLDLAPAEGPHSLRFDLQSNGTGSQSRGKKAGQEEKEKADQGQTDAGKAEEKQGDKASNSKAKGKSRDQ